MMGQRQTVAEQEAGGALRRIMLVAAAVALMALVMAANAMPAFAVGKTEPESCGLGFVVSHGAQFFGGTGHMPDNEYNPGTTNPGENLQYYRGVHEGGCTGNP